MGQPRGPRGGGRASRGGACRLSGGDRQRSPRARSPGDVQLRAVRAQAGNVRAARELYRQAIATGHHEHARTALLNLGNLEAEQGRTAEARDLYQRAMATGHSDTQTRARQGLQRLDHAAQRYFRDVPPYAGLDPELIRRRLHLDPDEVEDANWVTGHRPAYGNGEIEIWTRDGETHVIFLDQREPDDFHAYMYLKDRFGLE